MVKLFSTLIFLSLAGNTIAQNIEICRENTDIDISGTCINLISNNTASHTYYHLVLKIKSTYSNSKNLKVSRHKLIETFQFTEAMVWGFSIQTGVSYPLSDYSPSSPWTSPDYFTFDSLTEGVLYLYTAGPSSYYAKYRYYIKEYFSDNDSTAILDSIDVAFGSVLSIQNELQDHVNVYPNPATDVINVNVENLIGNGMISIYDMAGKIVLETAITNGKNQMNIEALKAGVYFYSIRNVNGVIETKKLLVQ